MMLVKDLSWTAVGCPVEFLDFPLVNLNHRFVQLECLSIPLKCTFLAHVSTFWPVCQLFATVIFALFLYSFSCRKKRTLLW